MTSKRTSISRARRAALALVPAVLAVAPLAAGVTTVGQAPLLAGAGSASSNWSGYASQKGPFTSVSASWVQPAGTCTAARTYSSFWVGLDGDGSNTVALRWTAAAASPCTTPGTRCSRPSPSTTPAPCTRAITSVPL